MTIAPAEPMYDSTEAAASVKLPKFGSLTARAAMTCPAH